MNRTPLAPALANMRISASYYRVYLRRYLRLLSPNAYLRELNGRPIQLHHGTNDKDVPYSFQKNLADDLRNAGQGVDAYRYDGDNHNLSGNLRTALNRSVQFFKENL